MEEYIISKDRQTSGQRTTDDESGASQLHLIYTINPHLVTFSPHNSSPDRSSNPEPALSFRYQTNGFATLYKGVVIFEPGCKGSGGHCMIFVMRYLSVSTVESEVNTDLRSSLLGSDTISGLYKLRVHKSVRFQATLQSISCCCLVIMSGSDSRRFPSRQNSLASVNGP